MLSRSKLSTRIQVLAAMIVTCFVAVIVFIYPFFSSKMYESRYLKTRHLVESAWGVLDFYAKEAKAGKMSVDEAKTLAREVVKGLRYEKSDYFWINDMVPRMVMHPIKAELDGKDLTGDKDPNGKALFVEMVNACKKDGAGFVSYYWPKPGSAKPVAKISYVKLHPDWQWIIGSGIYTDDVEADVLKAAITVGSAIVGIVLGALLLSWLMARSIAKPILRIVEGLEHSAFQVTTAAGDMAQTSQKLAQNAVQQAASVEETSASLEEMANMSREASSLTQGAEQLMNSNIEKSGESLRALVELTRNMAQIEADSDRISQIIKNIDEIAFQTNLLALNAAVEAARAGEAGAGFAVVADEVRNLAMRATEAAKSTQELLHGTIQRVSYAAKSIKEMNSAFEGIVESATVMGEKTASITSVSKEQAIGINQISKAVHEIDLVTQRVAEEAQSAAGASGILSGEVVKLKSYVDGLANLLGGAGSVKEQQKKRKDSDVFVEPASSVRPKRTQGPRTASVSPKSIAPRRKAREMTPEQVVPMNDGEFEDF